MLSDLTARYPNLQHAAFIKKTLEVVVDRIPLTKYRLYWASRPPPAEISPHQLARLIPVDFSTEKDAIHAAALIMRAKDFVWRIERPDEAPLGPAEIAERCSRLLEMFRSMNGGR